MGLDGLAMLTLSLLVLAGTGGLVLLWCLGRVVATARTAPAEAPAAGERVVLGVCLGRGRDLPPDFTARLRRALAVPPGPIRVLGGRTSPHDPRSEAEAGRDWLVAQGTAPARVSVEDASRNTLENLRAVRDQCVGGGAPPVLISNRYHLARVGLMARGLGLDHRLCAAEERLRLSPTVVGKLLLEAFFIHWYHVGRTTARVLGHRGMLARIS